jgi:outer membrane protein assembly factor BamA
MFKQFCSKVFNWSWIRTQTHQNKIKNLRSIIIQFLKIVITASAFGYIKYDSFDNKYFPKKGWFFNGDLQTYLFSSNYTKQFNRFSILKGEAGITRTFYKVINLKLQSEAGFLLGRQC